ncbi:MAG: quinone-dependent dihydroorotate dehydrogenase [Betaproteobacteria bacterium]|nr:MAG: quinone-dependent dihydroorotate dehydrogenase [Betaproteobacteria bacterium]
MSLYALARPLLFSLDPETAHRVTLQLAGFLPYAAVPPCPVRALGLQFPNPVGLAAGLDKNAEHIDALAKLGFGFIEVGTVTPRPQAGNPRPRLFRLPQAQALINRFGFNNVGLDAFLRNVVRSRYRGILGINIGRNADTPPERAADDYEMCLDKVYSHASYVAVNISSPNTRGLRDLQQKDQVENLLARLSTRRERLAERHGKHVPLVLKVAPDLVPGQVSGIANAVRRHGIEGVIATNTSVSREGVEGLPHANEAGGLSGKPLRERATRVLKLLESELRNEATLIGAGGIFTQSDAREKIAAGASLVQLYTGLIYRGPGLVAECVSAFRAK